MSLLNAVDYRTLLACESLLAIVYAFVFLGINRVFPGVRGMRSVALSFVLVLPDTLVVALRGHISPVVSVLMANTLLLGSLIAMYEGVVAFTGAANRRWLLWFAAFVSFAVGYFFTEVQPAIGPCLISVAVSMALIRVCTAEALLRRSFRSTQRTMLRLFGVFMALLAGVGAYQSWLTFLHGTAVESGDAEQAALLVRGVFFLALSGLFFLVLTSKELVSRRRMDAQRDPVSGMHRRHGLEAHLALELDRFLYQDQALSIALVAIDDLDAIGQQKGNSAVNGAIRAVAETLASKLRGSDHVGRFGDDDFLLVFSQTVHTQALIGAERIAREVAKLSFLGDGRPLTLSIGITEAGPGDSLASLISRSEVALEQARKDGHNCRRVVLPERTELVASDKQVSAVA